MQLPTSRKARITSALLVVFCLIAASLAGYALWVRKQVGDIPTFAEDAPGWVPPATTGVTETSVAVPTTATVDRHTDLGAGAEPTDLGEPPLPGDRAVTYLVFSTGSENLSAETARALNIPPERATHRDGLTDTIMLLVVNAKTGQVAAVSMPRDLYIPGIGDRINTIYLRSGPRALAETVGRLTGLPVDHMVAVNFTAFGELTEAVGGVDVYVNGPARDLNTGFEVEASGCTHLGPAEALAFARSRHWEVLGPNGWQIDGSATDFGRMLRQQSLLHAVAAKFRSPSALLQLNTVLGVAQRTLIVDRGLDFRSSYDLATQLLGDGRPVETYSYTGSPGWAGAASVIFGDARANGGTLAALRRVLLGQPHPAAPGGGGPAAPINPDIAPACA